MSLSIHSDMVNYRITQHFVQKSSSFASGWPVVALTTWLVDKTCFFNHIVAQKVPKRDKKLYDFADQHIKNGTQLTSTLKRLLFDPGVARNLSGL